MPQTHDRFSALSELMGEGIIGSIWTYAHGPEREGVVGAGVQGAEGVVRELGVGVGRFLKVLSVPLFSSMC